MRKRIGLVVIWVASLVAVGALLHAQAPMPDGKTTPTVIAGNDLGFRVDRYNGSTPVGTLVVRVNGQWVEADFSVGLKRLSNR
jgi:hypothetical protein